MKKPDCPFCDFQDTGVVICEDEVAFVVVSRRPINQYHVLVIPRPHFESFIDLPDDLAAHLFLMAKRLSMAVRQACQPDAISHLSDDDVTGKGFNIVAHYKFHIIPRYKDDRVEINWNRDSDPGVEVRSEYARQIREAIASS